MISHLPYISFAIHFSVKMYHKLSKDLRCNRLDTNYNIGFKSVSVGHFVETLKTKTTSVTATIQSEERHTLDINKVLNNNFPFQNLLNKQE